MTEWMLGSSYHFLGRQKEAQSHCDRGFAGASASALDIDFFGHDHHVRTLTSLGRIHWIQGRWDRGLASNSKAIQVAQRRGHPVGLWGALIYMANLLLWNRSLDEAETSCGRLEKLADYHAMAPYQATALALRGRWLCTRGDHEAAVERLRDGLARLHEANYLVLASGAQCALAESLMHTGHLQEALMVIQDAIDHAVQSGGQFDHSELLRTQGEIRLRMGDADGGEAAFLSAIAIAEEQGALSWRLSSGEALSRLWISKGRRQEAHAEASALLTLLDDCGPGEPLAATRDRLLALQADAGRRA
jgi:tetratricopeptide (TPR) repeat protein